MDRIGRDDLPAALLVSASVLLLGSVAATIDDVVGAGGGFDFDVDPRSGGIKEVNESLRNGSGGQGLIGQEQTIDLVICIDVLTTTPAILGIVAGVGLVLYGLYRRYNAATSLLVGTGVVPVVWGTYFLLTNCITADTGGSAFLSGPPVVTNEVGVNAPSIPPAVVAGVVGVVVLAGLVLLTLTTRGPDEPHETVADEPDTAGTALARAAGRAADRIAAANVPVDNAVYRAWLDMTGLLDIENPETTPPRDFAAAAIEAGLDEDDVAELTELFTDVRYGGKPAEEREGRAVEVLRRIEQTYREDADEEPGGTP